MRRRGIGHLAGEAGMLDGLELVEPGVVSCPLWRPEATPFGDPRGVDAYGGIGRKP